MRKLIRLTFCDFCYEETDKEVPVEFTFTFGVTPGEERPALYVAEVCAKHAEPFHALMAQLAILQPLASVTKQASASEEPAKKKPQSTTDGAKPYKGARLTCTICREDMTSTSLASHIWTAHLGESKPASPRNCPSCDFTSDSPVGMVQHRRATHGYSAIEEAYALVKERARQPQLATA